MPPPIGVAQLLALPEKQQRLREQELSRLRAVTAPPARRVAYTRYLADMAALDSLYGSLLADLRTARSLKDLEALHPRSPAALDERQRRNQIRREVEALRKLRTLHPHDLRPVDQKAPELQQRLAREARALGLAECTKNPYTAGHTYYENSGPEGNPAG